ncbi:MAG TPA: 50S ribosomal protein L22 [Bacilli bacterium]|nr:50S ribosomal protein L22 [Bacilli bacterium]
MARVTKKPAAKVEKVAKVKLAKPTPTEAVAISRTVGVTPRKARLVVDLVRGKTVSDALGILANVNKAASIPVRKTVQSAAANAVNNFGFDEETLFISEIQVNDSIKMKRFRPRAKGAAAGIIKRTSTIIVKVKERK